MAAFAISTDLAEESGGFKVRGERGRRLCCGCCCPLPVAAVALLGPGLILIGWSAATPHFAGVAVGLAGVAAAATVGVASRRDALTSRPAAALLAVTYFLVAFLVGLLVFVRSVSAPGPPVAAGTFPSSCYKQWYGPVPRACVRVAPGASAAELAGLVPNASTPLFARRLPAATIAAAAGAYLGGSFQTTLVSSHGAARLLHRATVLHATAVTPLFGFTDDVFVSVSCDAATGLSRLRAQSEQRLGSGDGGVNADRVARLQSHLRGLAWPEETGC